MISSVGFTQTVQEQLDQGARYCVVHPSDLQLTSSSSNYLHANWNHKAIERRAIAK